MSIYNWACVSTEQWLVSTTSLLYQLESCIVNSIIMRSQPCCQIQQIADAGSADHHIWLNGADELNIRFFPEMNKLESIRPKCYELANQY